MKTELAKAIEVLTTELKQDEAYYLSWQANIAMAFKDRCYHEGIYDSRIHDAANFAAEDFLNNLIKDTGNE